MWYTTNSIGAIGWARRIGKSIIKKLTGSRKAIGVMKGLTGDDYMRVYSHF